jgi:tetratricopeptide (TPR) repeat protein
VLNDFHTQNQGRISDSLRSQMNGMYSQYHMERQEFEKAAEYLQHTINLHRQGKVVDDWSLQYAFQTTSMMHTSKHQYKEALAITQENLKFAEKKGVPTMKANTLASLSYLYITVNDPKKAIKSLKEALAIWEQTEIISDYSSNYVNVGSLYANTGNMDSASVYFRKASDSYQKNGMLKEKASVLSSWAYYALLNKQEEKGSELIEQALQLAGNDEAMRQEIYFISNLGKLKTKVNQLNGKKITPAEQDTLRQQYARVQKRIEDYLGEANTYANSSALTVLQMLASLHEHLEQPELSLQYLKKD